MERRKFITLTLAAIASPIVVKADAFSKFLNPGQLSSTTSYPDLHFTGFKTVMSYVGYHGQFLWYGLFEVKPGVVVSYPWYVNVSGATLAEAEDRVNEGILTAHRLMAIAEKNKYFELGGCGYYDDAGEELFVTTTQRITFTSVQWKSWQEGKKISSEFRIELDGTDSEPKPDRSTGDNYQLQ